MVSVRKSSEYYRYVVRNSTRNVHIHIPGGNTNNPTAQERAKTVREKIVNGETVDAILQAIDKWRKRSDGDR